MSHKKSKAARRTVRAAGMHPRDVQTVPVKPFIVGAFLGRPGATFLGQREILPNCGRGLYRDMKRAMRTGAAA